MRKKIIILSLLILSITLLLIFVFYIPNLYQKENIGKEILIKNILSINEDINLDSLRKMTYNIPTKIIISDSTIVRSSDDYFNFTSDTIFLELGGFIYYKFKHYNFDIGFYMGNVLQFAFKKLSGKFRSYNFQILWDKIGGYSSIIIWTNDPWYLHFKNGVLINESSYESEEIIVRKNTVKINSNTDTVYSNLNYSSLKALYPDFKGTLVAINPRFITINLDSLPNGLNHVAFDDKYIQIEW